MHPDPSYAPRPAVATMAFEFRQSYLNPNAKCPVCGQSVFFYQSECGGRVFFDDVGWPWPKHPCTDSAAAQHNATIYAPSVDIDHSRADWTESYMVLKMVSIRREGGRLHLKLREIPEGFSGFLRALFSRRDRTYSFSENKLDAADLNDRDFRDAPSFLIEKSNAPSDRAIIQFICARKGKIIRVRMKLYDSSH